MLTPLQNLLFNNPFDVYSIAPSTMANELRRVMDELRMEASMGMRPEDAKELDEASRHLLDEATAYEMRCFAKWGEDPVLAAWAGPHDEGLDLLRHRVRLDTAITAWTGLACDVEMNAAIDTFGPSGASAAAIWADLLGEVLRRFSPDDELPALTPLQRIASTDVEHLPAVAAFRELVTRALDDISALARRIAQNETSRLSPSDSQYLLDAATWMFETVVGFQDLVRDGFNCPELAERTSVEFAERAKELSNLVSTTLFNAGGMREAETVISRCMNIRHTVGDREELLADLHLVRASMGRKSFSEAMERKDFATARAALRTVIENTDDPDERAKARELVFPLEEAERVAATPPPIRFLKRNWGWIATAAVFGGILVVANAGGSEPETVDAGNCVRYSDGVTTEVSCSSTGALRVARTLTASGSAYPRLSYFDSLSSRCPSYVDYYLYPTRDSWNDGDRQVLCIDE